MELFFIRHTTVDVPKLTCYGQTDVPLKDTFEQEAEAVKKKLEGNEFDAVFASPLSRCRKLAEYCDVGEIQFDDRLKEVNFGDWEMKGFQELMGNGLEKWISDIANVRPPHGESFADQALRLRSFLEDLKGKPYEKVAIFTHGGILMQAMAMFGLAEVKDFFNKIPENGEVLRITLD